MASERAMAEPGGPDEHYPSMMSGGPRFLVKVWRGLRMAPLQMVLIFLLALFIVPVVWMFYNSFKSNSEFIQSIWALPVKPSLDPYFRAWVDADIGGAFANSVFITASSVVLLLIFGVAASYALARLRFSGRSQLLYVFSTGMFVPRLLAIIPLFILLRTLKLVGYPGLILAFLAFELPFTIFVLVPYFRTLPHELEEAAIIDGCSHFGVFWRVMLPLAQPGIITAMIFDFISVWNDYLFALILLPLPEQYTLPVAIAKLQYRSMQTLDYTGLLAGFVIASLPSLLLYAMFQHRLAEGLTAGALKG